MSDKIRVYPKIPKDRKVAKDMQKILNAEFDSKIPKCTPTFQEISKQMRINQEIIMKEITEHVDKEILRLKAAINENGAD